MYVLVSGGVTIERAGVVFARIDNPGAVFGEMGVALESPATATVRASSDVVVRVVEDPSTFLTARPGAALAVLRITAARLDGMTHYLVDLKQQFADHENHLGMVDQILDTLVHHQAAAPAGRARPAIRRATRLTSTDGQVRLIDSDSKTPNQSAVPASVSKVMCGGTGPTCLPGLKT